MPAELDQLCVNTIRFLSADAVEKANSGHPGMPMGMADAAYVLWTQFMAHNPANPAWVDRDRFVLSAGHGSMLLYSLLYLTGYDMPLDEIKRFRQWESKTPGHPEYDLASGIETTTGPLGQGFATGVGMALATRMLAARYNQPGHTIVDHHVYGIVSDGDLMEGISSEAASLAGHLGLSEIIYLYDDNKISLVGPTAWSFTEDVGARFRAYDWFVQEVDGLDRDGIAAAIRAAQAESARPALIMVRSHIGYGAPTKQDTADAHGSPLGQDEVDGAKRALGWPIEPKFLIPDEALAHMRGAVAAGKAAEAAWQARFDAYAAAYPDLAAEFTARMRGELPAGWDADLPAFADTSKPIATRNAANVAQNALAARVPALVGGSADLSASTKTLINGEGNLGKGDFVSRNIRFGVREHAMGAMLNGLALHGGFIPYGGTFLTFSDYMRPAIRLAALMRVHVIYVFTHDSVWLGEDGPTHQPVEHVAALRTIPNLTVIRPSDATESAAAWRYAVQADGPVALILTRQNIEVLDRTHYPPASELEKGAYVLADADGAPDLILIASGSEVSVALAAREVLAGKGVVARVVAMPSWELYEAQPQAYRDQVLPPAVTARLAVEAGVSMGWARYVGPAGDVVALDRFGASAPYKVLMEKWGYTGPAVAARALALLGRA
ncbi:MAG: transketolase [Anaerolineae bacterium]|nr:transketolase [Anaerolineae bacterium]